MWCRCAAARAQGSMRQERNPDLLPITMLHRRSEVWLVKDADRAVGTALAHLGRPANVCATALAHGVFRARWPGPKHTPPEVVCSSGTTSTNASRCHRCPSLASLRSLDDETASWTHGFRSISHGPRTGVARSLHAGVRLLQGLPSELPAATRSFPSSVSVPGAQRKRDSFLIV